MAAWGEFAEMFLKQPDACQKPCVPGSCACDSTEICQEGLRLPPLKFDERGIPNQTLTRLIEKNVRVPIMVMGDLRAQLSSSCHSGEHEFLELAEVEHPVVIEQYGFVPDSGGPDRFRGGLSVIPDYRLTDGEAALQVRSDRRKFLPYGLAGGKEGTPSRNILNPDTENLSLPSKFTMTIRRNGLFRHVVPGAGGHGDPLERDPRMVLDDVRDEKISPAYPRREHVSSSTSGRKMPISRPWRRPACLRFAADSGMRPLISTAEGVGSPSMSLQ